MCVCLSCLDNNLSAFEVTTLWCYTNLFIMLLKLVKWSLTQISGLLVHLDLLCSDAKVVGQSSRPWHRNVAKLVNVTTIVGVQQWMGKSVIPAVSVCTLGRNRLSIVLWCAVAPSRAQYKWLYHSCSQEFVSFQRVIKLLSVTSVWGGSVAEWLACWTQAQ